MAGLVFVVAGLAFGAAPAGAEDSERDGLSRLLDGMAKSAGFEGRFVEEVELALLREPVRSEGALYFAPPDRLARFTTHPANTALLIDGKRVEFRDADGSRVDLSSSPLARHFTGNLLLLFSGDREALESQYRVSFDEADAAWKLVLIPRHAPLSKALSHITLEGREGVLEHMEVLDSEGARTVTHLRQVRSDHSFPASELTRLFADGRPLPRHSEAR